MPSAKTRQPVLTNAQLAELLKAVSVQHRPRPIVAEAVALDRVDTAERFRRLVLRAAAVLALCLLPALATAQATVNPTTVEFDPSPDHAKFASDGSAILKEYLLTVYVAGQPAVLKSASIGKPAPGTDGKVRVDASAVFSALSQGVTYEARVSASGPGGVSPSAASNTFQLSACQPMLTATSYPVAPLGAIGSIDVSVATGCTWTATSPVPWLTVTSGASGAGFGTVVFTATPNDLRVSRAATLTIAGQSVAVTQGVVSCTYGLTAATLPPTLAITAKPELIFTWGTLAGDRRALRKTASTERVAAAWYGDVVTVDVPAISGQPQQLAVYVADYDAAGRQEKVELLGEAGAVLDSRTLTDFAAGQYLIWAIRGPITVRVTKLAGPNAVVSGVFLGSASVAVGGTSAAVFSSADTATGGDWAASYGAVGSLIAGETGTTRWLVAAGGPGSANVVASAGCVWASSAGASWVSVTTPSGNGNGPIAFSIAPNTTTAPRSTAITVEGQVLPLTQAATATVQQPVDCVVSAWSAWSAWSDWVTASPSTEQRTQTRTRTVATPASNGGAACPVLTETASETRAITPPACTDLPTVFVTRYVMSGTGRPGSLMYVLYQANSPTTPVKQVKVKVDGAVVAGSPLNNVDVAAFGSMWFPTPASGSHKLAVEATNSCGSRSADSPLTLRVK